MKLPKASLLSCTAAQYHADPCESPSLSNSIAHVLVSESPRHAWLAHPRFGGHRSPPTDATDVGSIIHALLLNADAEQIAIVDKSDFRTKEAREMRDAAIAAGKIPITVEKFEPLLNAAMKLRERCKALGFEFTGRSELAIEWFDAGAKGPVRCRSRLDHVFIDRGVIWDVKTTRSANPKYLSRNFAECGYDIQSTAYPRALARLRPEFEGRVDMTFLYCETQPPYSVVPATPDGAFREIGVRRWDRAVHLWERCLERDEWPTYCDSPIVLNAPSWTINEELGAGETL